MTEKLKITFVLPRTGEWAAGGLRTVYQFANHLSRRGHQVTVVHPGRLVINPNKLDFLKNTVRYILKKLSGRFTPETWLKMDPAVQLVCVPSLSERYVPDGDVVIATAWQTAEWVGRYSKAKGLPYYYIQHLETWNGPQERVYSTWKLQMQKIVPSRWLLEIAEGMNETAAYIPLGLDVESFKMIVPREQRKHNQLMMLYHASEWKGCDDGIEALHLIRQKDPTVGVIFFGTSERPEDLPDWIEYYQSPTPGSLQELYNRTSIFVAPSRTEGWGLTGCEALLCGAALVATDIDGHREFAFDGETALTSPARSPSALAENVLRLIRDQELRIRLAESGLHFVRKLTWERATNSLEALLERGLQPAGDVYRKVS